MVSCLESRHASREVIEILRVRCSTYEYISPGFLMVVNPIFRVVF